MTKPTKNPAAVSLGRRGGKASKGVPKRFSAAEIAKRTARIQAVNKARKGGKDE